MTPPGGVKSQQCCHDQLIVLRQIETANPCKGLHKGWHSAGPDLENRMRSRVWSAAVALAVFSTPATAQTYKSSAGQLAVEPVVTGLASPWAFVFLPDGRMLVTEKPGRLRFATTDGKLSVPLPGLPKIFASGQGGLHDVALDRNFAQNQTIYFCFAEPHQDGGGRTSMARARLAGDRLEDVKVIFRQEGPPSSGRHFGCRIVQTADNNLILTMGDHGSHPKEAQNLANHIGKTVRVKPDGTVPDDNPFVGRKDAKPEIWTYGNRNMQGAALHPATGKVWAHEHGPQGGDEVNIIEKGKNYGWPVIGYGVNYGGAKLHEATSKPGMEQPVKYWVPSIAPSGMAFYEAALFPKWRGSLLVGALRDQMLVRLSLDGEKVTGEERFLQGLRERIRDVRVGPDGAIYVATDGGNGSILRVKPAN
jgi:glucose/arabinose dehydrogenase